MCTVSILSQTDPYTHTHTYTHSLRHSIVIIDAEEQPCLCASNDFNRKDKIDTTSQQSDE